jgi:peptide/nickel transport system substrate-binding protein
LGYTRSAPFDDLRARRAVAAAVDLTAVNAAVFAGDAFVPATLMWDGTPFYEPDVTLQGLDRDLAQRLLDELAADGSPLEFTLTSYPTTESTKVVQAVQAQLSAFRNVSVQVETLDFTGAFGKMAAGQFQAGVTGTTFVDPEPRLYQTLRSGSAANVSGIADPQLDQALDTGRRTAEDATRRAAYRTVQERVRELVPSMFWARNESAVLSATGIGGVAFYGIGSPRVDGLWRVAS